MKKIIKIPLIVVGSILGLFLLFILGTRCYFRLPVRSYYKVSKKVFLIPGNSKGFVAQGLCFVPDEKNSDSDSGSENETQGIFYITGYMDDGSASPIYLVNKKTKKLIQTVKLSKPDGTDFAGHCGGLSIYGDKIYVAGGHDSCLYVFDKKTVDTAENNSKVSYEKVVPFGGNNDYIGVAFTAVDDDLLIAGEFYRLPQYPVNPTHAFETKDGTNHAIAIAFKLAEGGSTIIPVRAYSLPDNVQGMTVSNGVTYLSTSWSLGISHIFEYDNNSINKENTINLLGYDLPLYILDSSSLIKDISAPAMAEEIVIIDDYFYLMNEAACNKYKFGKFTGARFCYKTKL